MTSIAWTRNVPSSYQVHSLIRSTMNLILRFADSLIPVRPTFQFWVSCCEIFLSHLQRPSRYIPEYPRQLPQGRCSFILPRRHGAHCSDALLGQGWDSPSKCGSPPNQTNVQLKAAVAELIRTECYTTNPSPAGLPDMGSSAVAKGHTLSTDTETVIPLLRMF